MKADPGCLAGRIAQPGVVQDLESGRFDHVFALLAKHELPLFIFVHGRPELVAPFAKKHEGLKIILDHCGLPRQGAEAHMFPKVLAMSEFENVSLKWAYAPMRFSAQPYPFLDARPRLEAALEAFGPRRLMWASDFTEQADHHTWAEDLFSLRDWMGLSEGDQEWILGRTARETLDWPAPAQVG